MKRLILTPFAVLLALTSPAFTNGIDVEDLHRLVARGDIHRTCAPKAGDVWLSLYQANGRFGSCIGPFGLHPDHRKKLDYDLQGGIHFTHLEHWVRAKFNADYLLPVGAIQWEREPDQVKEYLQHQSFYDGTIRTRFRTDSYCVDMISWFDPVHRDTAGFQIEVEGDCPAILFVPFAPAGAFPIKYGQTVEQSFAGKMEDGVWKATLQCRDRKTPLKVVASCPVAAVPQGARITLQRGRNDILITVGTDSVESAEQSLRETKDWWHATWLDSSWLDLPDDAAQKVWVRSLAYIHGSYNDDGIGCPPPNGLVGVGWSFPFPFDSACCQPLLLWNGRINDAKAWVEPWRDKIDGLHAYTKRIWHKSGVMLPHVFPYGSAADFHQPQPPNRCYYPVYNAGFLVRIAHDTALMTNDPAWTTSVAMPLIKGASQFYLDIARKESDGRWHFTITPSIGLDESGGNDQPDYLCTLVSAEYTFRRAIDYGLDADGRMKAILDDGLAYQSLLAKDGHYYSNAGSGAREFGRQKHPDQLFPLVHMPLGHKPDAPTIQSYLRRYDLIGFESGVFRGHTGGEFILASARMHNPDGWRKDWALTKSSRYTDPDWIQFYETSGRNLPFYVTTHGLFAQAILETVVSTWWGRLDLATCIPWRGEIRFGNIRTALGVTVSGQVADGCGNATLRAWKNASFPYQNRVITLKKGEEARVPIDLAPGCSAK